MNSLKLIRQSLVAGLLTGGLAFAGEVPPVASPKPSPSPAASQRKPHKEIKNKNNCCKGGCGCMDGK